MSRNFRYPDLFERAVALFGAPPAPIPPPDRGGYWPAAEMQQASTDAVRLPPLDALPFPESEDDELEGLWEGETPQAGRSAGELDVGAILGDHGAESLAWYVPYALSPPKWGVYFNGHTFPDYVAALAKDLGIQLGVLWPVAFHQIMVHELTHFHFEGVGTQLDIAMHARAYPSYIQKRYTVDTLYGPGPLEEAMATEREIAFARGVQAVSLPGDTGFRPRGYRRLLESIPYPRGYADWVRVKSPAHRRLAYETLSGIITDKNLPLRSPERVWVSHTQASSVPVYWWGSLDALPPGLRKSWTMPSVARLEKWLRRKTSCSSPSHGARHKQFTYPDGTTQPYKGGNDLLTPEAKQMAQYFGFRNLADFCMAVASMRPPPRFAK